MYRSFSKGGLPAGPAAARARAALEDIHPAGAGVRAQAVDPAGALVDDFRIVEAEHMIHVLNAPSPAATASLSIGRTIAALAASRFDLAGGTRLTASA